MAEILTLKESVLIYLDRSGGLQKLTADCKLFNGKSKLQGKMGIILKTPMLILFIQANLITTVANGVSV